MNATKEPERRRPGRPKMPEGQSRKTFVGLKMSTAEEAVIREASQRAKMDKSEWMRRALLSAAAMT